MDRLGSLIDTLRELAKDDKLDKSLRLLGAKWTIKNYIPYKGAERQSALERLRKTVRAEAKDRPNESDFWTSVEDIT
jgi:hypothetical protein